MREYNAAHPDSSEGMPVDESDETEEEDEGEHSGDESEEVMSVWSESTQEHADDNDYGSDWFLLRIDLWTELQYGNDKLLFDRSCNKWQRHLEIEMIGWPVLPLRSFYDLAVF